MGSTPREKHAAMIATLPEKTGRNLAQWLAFVRKNGPHDLGAVDDWLRRELGLGGGHAGVIASELAGGPAYARMSPKELLEAQYPAKKAALRPICNRLLAAARRLGKDVRVEPCVTYVSLIRGRQFAVVRSATATRVDLGLALKGVKAQGRLLARPPQGAAERITHRIELTAPGEVDAVVGRWLRKAYSTNG